MKITVEKSSFIDALASVQNVVPARTSVQILSNAMLKAEGGELVISTTNLDIGIRCSIAAKVDESGVTTLPVKRLAGIVRSLGSDVVELDVDSANVATIRSGSSFFKIIGFTAQDFPELPAPDGTTCFTLSAGDFREMLRKTSYAVSEDESRRIITGVLLSFKDAKLTMVATDGRRLALVENPIEFPPEIEQDIVLPSRSVSEISRLLKEEGDVKIYARKGLAIFQYGDTFLSTKLIDGTFPNFRQVIPASFEEKVEIPREALLTAIRRVTEISSDDKTIPTQFTFSDGLLTITMTNPEVGEARETMPITYAGKELNYTFNPEYVIEPLRSVDTDLISIELSGGHLPATFKCEIPFLYVLMPLRTGA